MKLDLEVEKVNRDGKELLDRWNTNTINMLVSHFYNQGKIEEKEYKKWLLDEKGTFIPKLKEDA